MVVWTMGASDAHAGQADEAIYLMSKRLVFLISTRWQLPLLNGRCGSGT